MKAIFFRKSWLGFVVVLLGLAAVYRVRFAPRPVAGHTVGAGEVCGEVMGAGTLEARVKTVISARIQERLAEVLVDQGDGVQAGQLLARLDDAETQQQVAIAEATLAAAQATVERVRADEARAQAVLHQAELDHRRASELLAGKIAAQADFDKVSEVLRIAAADLERARFAIVEAERQVLTAEKTRLYQIQHLAFTEIRSPYDGLITRRDRDPGGIVVPGASILQLVATNEIWVSAWVDETAMSGLKTGQAARVVFRSRPEESYAGEVARLGRETDRETREFLIDVRVKQLPENWTIGQRAEVFIETGCQSAAVLLPAAFVSWHEGRPGVFVDEGGRARWRAVVVGAQGSEGLEAVQGLALGERIVRAVERDQAVVNGERVRVQ